MSFQTLTLQSIRARPIVLKLKRPVVARIATLTDWPLILIDLYTEEGVIGRAYLEPYIPKSMRYLVPALHDLGEMLKGRRLAPIEFYEAARKSFMFSSLTKAVAISSSPRPLNPLISEKNTVATWRSAKSLSPAGSIKLTTTRGSTNLPKVRRSATSARRVGLPVWKAPSVTLVGLLRRCYSTMIADWSLVTTG